MRQGSLSSPVGLEHLPGESVARGRIVVRSTVAAAGWFLALAGNALYLSDLPQQLHRSVVVPVDGVPGFCPMLSVLMAATFLWTSRPQRIFMSPLSEVRRHWNRGSIRCAEPRHQRGG